jgi:hypothetical protein
LFVFEDEVPGLLTVGTSLEENELCSFGGVAMLGVALGDMMAPVSTAFSEIYLRSIEWRSEVGRDARPTRSLTMLELPLIEERLC